MAKTIGVALSLKDKCLPAITKIAQKFGLTEKEAQRFNKTVEAGDRVDKMSQNCGDNVDSLQMARKALVNQIEMTRKGLKDSIGYFKKPGVAVKDSSGQFGSRDEVFNEVANKLQQMKNPTEKTIIAQKLFGHSAIELKPLVNQNAQSIDILRQKANDSGMIMSDEAVDSAVNPTDTMNTAKLSFAGVGITIGAALIPHIQSLSDQLINITPAVTALVAGLGIAYAKFEGFRSLLGDVGAVVKMFAMASPIGISIRGIKSLCDGLNNLAQAHGGWRGIGTSIKNRADNVSAKMQHHALGTSFSSGGTALAGEYGPKIVNIPRGANVLSTNQTQNVIKANKNIEVHMHIAGNIIGEDDFFNKIISKMTTELNRVLLA